MGAEPSHRIDVSLRRREYGTTAGWALGLLGGAEPAEMVGNGPTCREVIQWDAAGVASRLARLWCSVGFSSAPCLDGRVLSDWEDPSRDASAHVAIGRYASRRSAAILHWMPSCAHGDDATAPFVFGSAGPLRYSVIIFLSGIISNIFSTPTMMFSISRCRFFYSTYLSHPYSL